MAFTIITLENPLTGKIRQAPIGISWTTLFFGPFPALLRGHWAGAAIVLIANLLTLGLASIIFMFIYNKMYLKNLLNDGFKASQGSTEIAKIEQKTGQKIPLMVM
jgi:hypothetical protein